MLACDLLVCDVSLSESPLQVPSPPFSLWVFVCLARWSDRMNLLLQRGQANRFSPVWVLRCRCSSSDLVKRLPQKSQLQTKGRSPVCHRRCAFRWLVLPYTLPHPGMWQLWRFLFLMCAPAGPSRSASWQLGQSQTARPVYRRWDLGDMLDTEAWPRPNPAALADWPNMEAWLPRRPLAARPSAEAVALSV